MANSHAKSVYLDVINLLDEMNWTYDREDDNLIVRSGVKSKDLPIEFLIYVDEERNLVRFISNLPITFEEDKLFDGALAICYVNNRIVNGTFDLDITDGSVSFRLISSFEGGVKLSKDVFEYMIFVSTSTIDEYNDKLFMLAKNMISTEQFVKAFEDAE